MATSVLLFAGLDKNGDNNLWVTDGTAAGTSEISIAGVGSEGLFGLPPATPYFAALPDGRVLFSGIDANGHVNLWVTNGTSAGTSEISISKQFAGGFNPQHLTVFGSKVLFEGLDSQDHGNLWVTNGTAAGTSELSVKGQHPNSFVPQDFTVLGSKVLFNGQDSSNNYDLWVTNGTAAGTSEISVPSTNVSPVIGLDPQDLVTLGSEVLFRGLDHSNLWGLWVTDGTVQGTSELVRHGSSFEPDDLTVFGNKVLFNSFDASDRINLWVTDGTAAGTSLLTVANIDTNEFDEGLSPRHFFAFGSEVLFAGDGPDRLTGLWVTDGTGAGTSEISVAGADTAGFGLEPGGFTLLGSEVLFNGTDALSQQNLWVTDGTSAGTFELSIADAASVGAGFFQAVVFGSGGSSEVLYASADLNNLGGLWVTDGTTAGTSELSVAGLGQAQDSPGNFVAFGSLLLFEGADANGHLNLWQTDGTAGGTSEVSVPGASSLGLFDGLFSDALIFPFGSEMLFTGNDSAHTDNLWVTDGTLAGTSELSATGADATDGLFPRSLTLFGSEVLFSGLDTAQRSGLWVTNGTSAGTSELSVAHSQLFSQGLDNLTVLGSEVLFVATDGSDNTTLWVTDGTGAGTSELAVPNSEAFSQGIGGLTALGSEVLFAGTDQDFNANLWVTNGTAAGTSELSVPGAGPNPDLEPDNFLVFGSGSEVLFTGYDANGLNNLWVTNGTGPGTSELSVAGAGPFGLSGYAFATFGSKVLFNGADAKHHRELWITNGTAAGTSELSVAGAFSEGLNPGNFVVFGSEVLFQGHGADGAANLWVTNGTVAGTSELFSTYVPSLTPGPFVFFTPTSAGAVPSVSAVLSPDAGEDFKAGGVVTIGLLMNEPVKVTGTPKLLLNDGGFASYTGGSNSDLLTFTYKVLAGQNTSSGAALQITSASLNGGTIKMSGGTAGADLSAAAGVNLGVIIDTTVPTISSVTATPASGAAAGLGGAVAIDVHLSEAVVVSGTPALKLNDGGTAFYVPGGSSNPTGGVLEFDYTVASGQNTPDLTISSLSLLGGASITDSAGNAVNPALPASKNLHLTIDSIRPSVTSASATPGGVASGGTATITLKMSQPVSVGGSGPVLDLNDGGSATYVSGGGTTSLTFRYVAGGETTADLKITGIESAGTVTGSAGNALSSSLSADLKTAVNTDSWKTGKSGIFGAGSNWTATSAPTSSQEAVIAVAGTYTVSAISGATVAALDIANKTATLLVASGATFTATKGTGPDANLGTVVVQSGGIFAPGGTFHNSRSLKAATGGDIVLGGSVANGSAGGILASGASARVDLNGATISGGKLQTLSGGVIETVADNNVLSRGTITSGSLVKINDGTELRLAGLIANSGTISLGGIINGAELYIDPSSAGATLSGGGKVILSPSGENSILAGFADTPFININNTIAGAGRIGIGDIELVLINSGTINANTAVALTIETGPNQVINAGILEATSTGRLAIDSNVLNSKTIEALGTSAAVIVSGVTITNTASGVVFASGSGAHVDLDGATVSGGIVKATSHGVLNVSGGRIGSGTLVETLSGGSAIVSGTVANSGTLIASALGSLIEVAGVVSGGAVIVGNGIVDVLSGGTANIAFRSNGSGGVEIADKNANSSAFTGGIFGFGGVNHTNHKQFIDLVSVTSAAHTISFSYTSAAGSGTLTVSSGGAVVASIDLVGAYTSSSFHIASGISGTVAITDPAVVNGGTVEPAPVPSVVQHGIDLPNLGFGGPGTLAYAQTANAGNTLTVPDGRHAATIVLLGNSIAGSFVLGAAPRRPLTAATEPSVGQESALTMPHRI